MYFFVFISDGAEITDGIAVVAIEDFDQLAGGLQAESMSAKVRL
jgi:hypothetical protein